MSITNDIGFKKIHQECIRRNSYNQLINTVLKTFNPLIKKYARKYKSIEDGEQELIVGLLEIIQKMPLLNHDGQYALYISRAIKNTYYRYCKKISKYSYFQIEYNEEIQYYKESSEPDAFIQVDNKLLLKEAIDTLSSKEKLIIKRAFYLDEKGSDIAKKLDISRQGVFNTKKRALNKLRKYIESKSHVLFV